ncbi:MAG: DUF1320 domain-containing protein [Defluviicoccus sp.]|nr:DUF1320 domain-containing protein [Defluviicoccus sp.]
MAYATVQDCIDRRGEESLRELADDPHADALAWDALERALEDASDEIDAYVGARHDLPLDPAPRILVRLCVEIGVYLAAADADQGTDERRRRYEGAIGLLRDIREGRASLGAADPDPPAEAEAPVVQVESFPRVMTRDSLRGML